MAVRIPNNKFDGDEGLDWKTKYLELAEEVKTTIRDITPDLEELRDSLEHLPGLRDTVIGIDLALDRPYVLAQGEKVESRE